MFLNYERVDLVLENHAKLIRNIDKLQILDVKANFMAVFTDRAMVVSTARVMVVSAARVIVVSTTLNHQIGA